METQLPISKLQSIIINILNEAYRGEMVNRHISPPPPGAIKKLFSLQRERF